MKVDKTLIASVALHVLVLGWAMVSFSTKALELPPEDSVAGRCHLSRSACQGHGRHEDRQEGKPEAAGREGRRSQARRRRRRQDHREGAGRDRDRAAAAAQGRGKAGREEARPAEGRREAKGRPKEEPKPIEKKPDPAKVDPIAEAIKKEEKKPPPKPVQAAKPPEPQKPKIWNGTSIRRRSRRCSTSAIRRARPRPATR